MFGPNPATKGMYEWGGSVGRRAHRVTFAGSTPMIGSTLEQDILDEVHRLAPEQQQQVLAFARILAAPSNESGKGLLRAAGTIPLDDLAVMERVIEEECERIDDGEW